MAFTVTVAVAKPPSQVFDLLADARNEQTWNAQVIESELLTPEPVGKDSRFRTVNRGKPYDARFTTFEPPRRMVFEVSGAQMDITGEFTVAPAGAGTTLTAEFDFRPKGFLKMIFPLMKGAIGKDLPRQFQSFKAFAESR